MCDFVDNWEDFHNTPRNQEGTDACRAAAAIDLLHAQATALVKKHGYVSLDLGAKVTPQGRYFECIAFDDHQRGAYLVGRTSGATTGEELLAALEASLALDIEPLVNLKYLATF